jgi:ADP-ribosyl-[dinitrogen reductase] hydrolase
VADEDVPHGMPHVEVRLVDSDMPDENPNLDYVLLDTANVVAQLRRQGSDRSGQQETSHRRAT